LARALSGTLFGLEGMRVEVEADIADGLPGFHIVGLGDRALQEARERVKIAINNSGFQFPGRRVTVNLAPAQLPKEGTGFLLARALSGTLFGLEGMRVEVEADIADGLPGFHIVGLGDRALQEARERVKIAINNSGFQFPGRRVTVNLAPAQLPKEGTGFDLA